MAGGEQGCCRLPLHPHWNKAEHFKPPTRRSVAPLSRSPLKAGQPRCRDQGEGDNVKGWSQPPNHSSNKCTPGHTPGHARRSRTSGSASSSPSQAVPKNLPQPKRVSQKLPKKGRKTTTGDTELGLFLLFFFFFSPHKQKKYGAQPSHQLVRSLQKQCQEFRFISGMTLMGY